MPIGVAGLKKERADSKQGFLAPEAPADSNPPEESPAVSFPAMPIYGPLPAMSTSTTDGSTEEDDSQHKSAPAAGKKKKKESKNCKIKSGKVSKKKKPLQSADSSSLGTSKKKQLLLVDLFDTMAPRTSGDSL